MQSRDLTAADAVVWALDPRNDHGPAPINVMAQGYGDGSDCESDDCPEDDCYCWVGLTPEDVETWRNDDGSIDLDGFGAWGPFALWYDTDPGAPRTDLASIAAAVLGSAIPYGSADIPTPAALGDRIALAVGVALTDLDAYAARQLAARWAAIDWDALDWRGDGRGGATATLPDDLWSCSSCSEDAGWTKRIEAERDRTGIRVYPVCGHCGHEPVLTTSGDEADQ